MIGVGCPDQGRIGVDTDHHMPTGGTSGANSSRPAAVITIRRNRSMYHWA